MALMARGSGSAPPRSLLAALLLTLDQLIEGRLIPALHKEEAAVGGRALPEVQSLTCLSISKMRNDSSESWLPGEWQIPDVSCV